MRFVVKTNRCPEFEAFLADKTPTTWTELKADIKLILHQHLLEEQQHLCIYCQQSIPRKTTKDIQPDAIHPSHIEHIRPRDLRQDLTFAHTNLAVSCNGFDTAAPSGAHDFCGHPKENNYDENLFLNPFEIADIETCFRYDNEGNISPSGKRRDESQFTIDLLKLNHPVLQAMRAEQYLLFIEAEQNGDDIELYLDEKQSDLPKFHSMLKQLFHP